MKKKLEIENYSDFREILSIFHESVWEKYRKERNKGFENGPIKSREIEPVIFNGVDYGDNFAVEYISPVNHQRLFCFYISDLKIKGNFSSFSLNSSHANKSFFTFERCSFEEIKFTNALERDELGHSLKFNDCHFELMSMESGYDPEWGNRISEWNGGLGNCNCSIKDCSITNRLSHIIIRKEGSIKDKDIKKLDVYCDEGDIFEINDSCIGRLTFKPSSEEKGKIIWPLILNNVSFYNDRVSNIHNYKTLIQVRSALASKKIFLGIDGIYKTELELHEKLSSDKTDKIILVFSNMVHGHRTSIIRPIMWLLCLYLIVYFLSTYLFGRDLTGIFIPGGIFIDKTLIFGDSLGLGFCGAIVLLVQFFIYYLYFEIIVISRKFT